MMLASMILFTNDPAYTLNNIELQKDKISFLSMYFSAVGKQLKTFFLSTEANQGHMILVLFFFANYQLLIPTVL